MKQSEVFERWFEQKGYDNGKERLSVQALDRGSLIESKTLSVSTHKHTDGFGMVFDYNIQCKKIENIIKKHWYILSRNKVLNKILPPIPRFIYRKAPTLRDKLAPGIIDPSNNIKRVGVFPFLTGFYSCGKCISCKTSEMNKRRKEFRSTATDMTYPILFYYLLYHWGGIHVGMSMFISVPRKNIQMYTG